VEHGPVLATGNVYEGSQPLLSGESLLAYDQGELQSADVLRELKKLMRHVLAFYLDGKPLKSRELFR
jgi:recombinational DNA repair protein (RecF pathway)